MVFQEADVHSATTSILTAGLAAAFVSAVDMPRAPKTMQPAPVASTQPANACLHGDRESASERQRRQQAVSYMRAINTMEHLAKAKGGRFMPVEKLALPVPDVKGFEIRFVLSPDGYAALMKDRTDACGYSLYSTEQGLIYEGYPLGKA